MILKNRPANPLSALWPRVGGRRLRRPHKNKSLAEATVKGRLYGAGEFLQVQEYANVQRWTDAIAKLPAAQRGRKVNCSWGDLSDQLHERHEASDFETKTQDEVGDSRTATADDSSGKGRLKPDISPGAVS
jgi:hypothetical protein